MKKLLSVILSAVILISAQSGIFAANGDIAGNIYSTDIKACINGVWVDSYNIGGKTAVIVEDITNQYRYYDALRTLVIDDFSPERLVSGGNTGSQKSGEVIGNIYETDIKTYFRGKELTSYSLDGKMAVVVEDLGADNTFSDIGGRFVWNPDNRTIVLESMYRYPYSMRTMLEDKGYNIMLTESYGSLNAEPARAALTGGYILLENEIPDNSIVPVKYEGEIIGYRCRFPEIIVEQNEDGKYESREIQVPVEYFYTEKVEDMIFRAGVVTPTAEEWLNYFKQHTISTIKQQFETDEYLFLYMFSSLVMHGTDRLIKINKSDGTKQEYQRLIDPEAYKRFDNVVIDEDNEKVYFSYGKDYVLDLKTDEVMAYNKLETDIGIGMADGQPSEQEETEARSGQSEFRILSGGEELVVNSLFAHEYYYANMLPLKEVFDFLNIGYSFENNTLTIDTSKKKQFTWEMTENKTDIIGQNPIYYLYVDKVIVDGEETEITYQYISGHFDRTQYGRSKAKPYVCNGKVYINTSFISMLYDEEEAV